MLLKSVLLSKVVDVLSTKSTVCLLAGVEVFTLKVELILAVLETSLELADLSHHVEVSSNLELILLTELIEVGDLLITITTKENSITTKA